MVEAVLRDTGESLLLMHELEYAGGEDNVEALRWLLLASDWGSARMGMASLPGSPGCSPSAPCPPPRWSRRRSPGVSARCCSSGDEYDRLAAG